VAEDAPTMTALVTVAAAPVVAGRIDVARVRLLVEFELEMGLPEA